MEKMGGKLSNMTDIYHLVGGKISCRFDIHTA